MADTVPADESRRTLLGSVPAQAWCAAASAHGVRVNGPGCAAL